MIKYQPWIVFLFQFPRIPTEISKRILQKITMNTRTCGKKNTFCNANHHFVHNVGNFKYTVILLTDVTRNEGTQILYSKYILGKIRNIIRQTLKRTIDDVYYLYYVKMLFCVKNENNKYNFKRTGQFYNRNTIQVTGIQKQLRIIFIHINRKSIVKNAVMIGSNFVFNLQNARTHSKIQNYYIIN